MSKTNHQRGYVDDRARCWKSHHYVGSWCGSGSHDLKDQLHRSGRHRDRMDIRQIFLGEDPDDVIFWEDENEISDPWHWD